MNSLVKRSLSGIIFVLIIVLSIFTGQFFYGVVFTAIVGLTLYEFYRLFQKAGSKPLTSTGLILGILLFIGSYLTLWGKISVWLFATFLVAVIAVVIIIAIFRKDTQGYYNLAITFLGFIYVVLPFSLLNYFAFRNGDFQKEFLLSFLFIIWIYDTFAYITGSRIGRHKLAPKISPHKTWEGLAGGVIVAMAVGIFLLQWAGIDQLSSRLVIIPVILLGATLGDMSESLLKRNFKIKDSGNILPGHGGLLDRFDSLLLAAPLLYIYLFFTGIF